VLAGWASAEEPVPPLLVVPVGTANLMGQHLGVRWDEEHLEDEVVAALLGRRVVQLDAARADERLLLLVAGVGFDAAIVHEVARRRKGPITKGSYIGPALAALWEMRDVPFLNVVVDGREIAREVPGMVFVGNIPQYGTGFAVLPEARPDDGVLDVCVMPCRSRGELVSLFLHAAAGEHLQMEGVKYVKGRQVSIESARPVPVQIDGEAAGFTPLKIELLPVRLPFIVPGGNP
jgi:diacylglycerol kinase family enzyme